MNDRFKSFDQNELKVIHTALYHHILQLAQPQLKTSWHQTKRNNADAMAIASELLKEVDPGQDL